MKKLFIDVSSLLIYAKKRGFPTGIQRVTMTTLDEAIKILGKDQVFVSYYDAKTTKYLAVSASSLDGINVLNLLQLSARLGSSGNIAAQLPSLEKYSDHFFRRNFHRLSRDFNALIRRESHFKKRRLTIEKWKAARRQARKVIDVRPVQETVIVNKTATHGDVILLIDAGWDVLNANERFKEISDRGVAVVTFVHDLIPLVTPQFVSIKQSFKFGHWLLETTRYAKSYIANSKATGDDLRAFLNAYDLDTSVADIPLAQAGLVPSKSLDIDESFDTLGLEMPKHQEIAEISNLRPEVALMLNHRFALVVGTLDVRKNIWRVAQAWKTLSDAGTYDIPKLVFAGSHGWQVEDFFRMMDGSGWLNGWIEFIPGPSDAELDFLYKNCEFTINASMYEGWGLPIGEGLSYGKTGVVSNVSSMPEVGGDMVEYCDPMSIASIQVACEKLITDTDHRKMLEDRIANTKLRSWRDVTVDILKAIDMDIPASALQDESGKAAE